MTNPTISCGGTPTPEEQTRILGGLIEYNDAVTGPAGARELSVIARENGEIVGGLLGMTHWNWMHVRFFWIAESFRRRGLGTQLLRSAEAEAVARGCRHAHLDTFSFQALSFYEKHGYVVFGNIEDYPEGYTRYFLQKRDLSAARAVARGLG